MVLERPRITAIAARRQETERHITIAFEDNLLHDAAPGTFCMVWVPGVDEVPMGLGYNENGNVTLTIEGKGDCTRALLALPEGAPIGVRGPYGHGFDIPPRGRVCFVGGGTGIAPMARGAQAALAAGLDVTVISGARSNNLLLLDEALPALGNLRYLPCTNDGSHGFSGFTTQQLQQLLDAGEKFDIIYACGPEPMMVAVVEIAGSAGIRVEASLERYMKCATGICDACTVGDGLRVCKEGPVFDGPALKQIPEFGVGHRDSAGIMHPW